MATTYINPTSATNGAGTLLDPKNTWVGLTFTAGNEYLQCGGTTYTGQYTTGINVHCDASGTAESRIVLGAYEPQTGVRIRDGSKRARIDGLGAYQGVRIGNSRAFVDVDGFEVFGHTGLGGSRAVGIYVGGSESTPANNCRVMNCYVHDIKADAQPTLDNNGMQVFGSDCLVRNNLIEKIPDDGLWAQGERLIIEHNIIRRCAQSGRDAGDCLQVFGTSTLRSSGGIVRFNRLDKSNAAVKQCLIYQGDSTSDGVKIYGNVLSQKKSGAGQLATLFVAIPNAVIFGNLVLDGDFGILVDTTGITTVGHNAKVMGNLVLGSTVGITQTVATTGMKIWNNTIARTTDYAIYCDTDTTVDVRNNIVYKCQKGIALENGATEDFNCLFGTVSAAHKLVSLGGGALTLGANSIESDPLLTGSYVPMAGSPCIGAGVSIPGSRHYGGKSQRVAPDIGARRYVTPRDAALR